MSRIKSIYRKGLIGLLILLLMSAGCFAECITSLNVALYGYVPRYEQFKKVVAGKWKQENPNVALNFVDWDCYSSDPDQSLDVFVFDSTFLKYFVEKGYLLPLNPKDIQNKKDIIDFSLEGCRYNGKYYGIPQIGCSNLLYYRNNDYSLKHVTNIDDLYKILGDNTSGEIPPPNNTGLLIDLAGGTTCACLYMETVIDVTRDIDPILPDPDNLNPDAINNLRKLVKMAGTVQAQYEPDPYESYQRASWFAEGSGKAYVGFAESMWKMKDYANLVDFKLFSYGKTPDIPVFYVDIVGVNSHIKDCYKKTMAIKLANTITATDTMIDCLKPTAEDPYPQYLIPLRQSIFANLENDFPIYKKIHQLIKNDKIYTFRLGPDSRQWLTNNKKIIKDKIYNFDSGN
jgi:thiamine pyridinylase